MDKKKSEKLLLMAAIMMLIAAIILIVLKVFAHVEISSSLYITFFVCSVTFFAAFNNNKSEDK